MQRSKAIFALALAAMASVLIVRTARYERGSRQPPTVSESDSGKWNTIIPEIRFSGVPLEAVVREIAAKAGARVDVDWRALLAAGFKQDAPVSLHLYDLPLHTLLELAMEQAKSSRTERAVCLPQDGGILITSQTVILRGRQELHMYDVSDLAHDSTSASHVAGFEERVDEIGNLLQMIDSSGWGLPGGSWVVGSACGRLFVVQSPWNHRVTEQLLYNLRRAKAAQTTGSPPDFTPIELHQIQ